MRRPFTELRPGKPRRSRFLRRSTLAAAGLVAVLSVGLPAAASTPAPAPARPSLLGLFRAVGSAPQIPFGSADLGAAAQSSSLQLDVVLQPRDPAALANFATAVSTPGNPMYEHFLAKGQFASVFGPTSATIAAVTAGLQRLGLHPGTISANHLVIPVTTTVGSADSAFHFTLSRYRLASGRVAFANTVAPTLPATFSNDVQDVIGLDNLVQQQPADEGMSATPIHVKAGHSAAAATSATAAAATGPQACTAARNAASQQGGWTLTQLAKAYSLPPLYAKHDLGKGVTIALYELAAYSAKDIKGFQSCYHTKTSITNVKVDGGTTNTGGAGEAELDIEVVIGIAPDAKLLVYEASPTSNTGFFDEYQAIVKQDRADVMSTSWGGCEVGEGPGLAKALNTVFEQAAAQGQSLFAVPGDEGSEGCLPNDFGTEAEGIGHNSDDRRVAIDSATHTAYVTEFNSGDVAVVNDETGQIVKTFSIGANTDPFDVAIDAPRNRIFVTAPGSGGEGFAVINGKTCDASNTSHCSFDGVGTGATSDPLGIAVDPTTQTLYVATPGNDEVEVWSEATLDQIGFVNGGDDPSGVTVDTKANDVYFTATLLNEVGFVNGAHCDVADTSDCVSLVYAHTGLDPSNVLVDHTNHRLYVANSGGDSINVFNAGATTTQTPIAIIPTRVAFDPVGLALSPFGTALLVGCSAKGASGDAGVVVISLATDKVTSLLSAGSAPLGVAVDPDQDEALVADAGDSALIFIPLVLSPWSPATQPFVTGVGGTDLLALGPKPAERVWDEPLVPQNDHPAGAGGGGISVFWKMPSYQKGPGVHNSESSGFPCGNTHGLCREVPDVSASADPVHGYLVFEQGQWESIGGTSAATPLWAAIVGLLDVQQGKLHKLGFLNPALYKDVAAGKHIVNDITAGNDDYTTTGDGLFRAGKGYDMASGLGSPIGTGLSKYVGFNPRPAISKITVVSGRTGTRVVIVGRDLFWATSVSFGSTSLKFTVVNASEVVATVSLGRSATAVRVTTGLRVTTPGGTSNLVRFTS